MVLCFPDLRSAATMSRMKSCPGSRAAVSGVGLAALGGVALGMGATLKFALLLLPNPPTLAKARLRSGGKRLVIRQRLSEECPLGAPEGWLAAVPSAGVVGQWRAATRGTVGSRPTLGQQAPRSDVPSRFP